MKPEKTNHNPTYNYEDLRSFLEETAEPGKIAGYLDVLLYCLVYHENREGGLQEGFFKMYDIIFELKCTLQEMSKPTD